MLAMVGWYIALLEQTFCTLVVTSQTAMKA
jgi:hypothetical protein